MSVCWRVDSSPFFAMQSCVRTVLGQYRSLSFITCLLILAKSRVAQLKLINAGGANVCLRELLISPIPTII